MQLKRFLTPQAVQMLRHLVCVANVNIGFKTSNETERSIWEEEDGNIFNISERDILGGFFFLIKVALVKSRSTLKIGQLCKWMEGNFSAILPAKGQIISYGKTYLLKLIAKNCSICNLQIAVSTQQNPALIFCHWLDPFRSYCNLKWIWKSTPALKLLLTCCRARGTVLGHVTPWLSVLAGLQSHWWGWEKKKIRAHIDMEIKLNKLTFLYIFLAIRTIFISREKTNSIYLR